MPETYMVGPALTAWLNRAEPGASGVRITCFCISSLACGAQYTGDGHCRFGHIMRIVFAQQRGHGGGYLRLRHRGDMAALAERRRIGADYRDPDILGALLLDSVLLPLGEAAAAAVIRGDDEGRVAAVLRHRLHGVPQLMHEMVHAMRAVEDQIVAALMPPVVRLAVSDEQHPRMRLLDVVQ